MALEAASEAVHHHSASFKAAMESVLFPKFVLHVQSLTAGTATKASELITKLREVYSDADVTTWTGKSLINTAEVRR